MVVNSLSLVCLFSGIIFVVLGLILRFFPPKKVNWLYGYRTRFSMQNLETWQQANRYSAQLLWQMGLVMMVLGIVTFPLPRSPFTGTFAGILVMLILISLTYYLTEKHLKKHFDEFGKRKKSSSQPL